ncbi:MFS family permease [Arthrobacter pigmenti]|uniref:MFS family permease n=1 Tax=Arthrobacter pigmenti TaxID=271432 RepID=A0A846RRE9_9MICC|nr:MFS family permease [Arthrobacter pigmenti]
MSALNSSMIAVALVSFMVDFDSTAVAVSWLASAFYLTSAVAQPVLGRMADRFGARRVFLLGMGVVVISGVLGPLSANVLMLVACRVIQAVGASAAYPAAVSMIRQFGASHGSDVQRALSGIATANFTGAAVGPVLGGFAVWAVGWEALFWVNIPLALFAALGIMKIVPRDEDHERVTFRALVVGSDLLGIALFAGATVLLLLCLMPPLGLLTVALASASVALFVIFLVWEKRTPQPFLNVVMLRGNKTLLSVYARFIGFNLLFYGALFGIPQWLEIVKSLTPAQVGLVMLPLASLGGIMSALFGLWIARIGSRALVLGSTLLAASAAGILLLFTNTAPLWVILVACALFGISYAGTNLGLQSQMYESTDPSMLGVASGLYQSSRSLGGVLSTGLLAVAFTSGVDTAAIQTIAIAMLACSLVLAIANAISVRSRSTGSRLPRAEEVPTSGSA